MSAIYQGEEFVITEQDLAQVEQELNPADDYQSLIVSKSAFNEPLEAHEDDLYSEVEEYLLTLESRWEEPVKPLSEDEEREWLEYEQERLESDILEQEQNQYL
jgi:hypothetical protein